MSSSSRTEDTARLGNSSVSAMTTSTSLQIYEVSVMAERGRPLLYVGRTVVVVMAQVVKNPKLVGELVAPHASTTTRRTAPNPRPHRRRWSLPPTPWPCLLLEKIKWICWRKKWIFVSKHDFLGKVTKNHFWEQGAERNKRRVPYWWHWEGRGGGLRMRSVLHGWNCTLRGRGV
jgi:hypothetical protein